MKIKISLSKSIIHMQKVIRLLLEERIVYLELNPTADQTEGKNIVFELMTYNLV